MTQIASSSADDAPSACPSAPLLPLTAGRRCANSSRSARASAASDARVPLPWALTQSISAGATPA
jgi:hypothetical protein